MRHAPSFQQLSLWIQSLLALAPDRYNVQVTESDKRRLYVLANFADVIIYIPFH